jgi:uncharacterized membrane protein
MPTGALYALVLAAAVAHASWNALIKGSSDRLLMLTSMRVVGFSLGILVAVWVPLPSAQSIPYLVAAACIHYIYYVMMLNAYRVGDMSQVYPISRGIAPVLVAILAVLFADEVMGSVMTVAVLILSLGIVSLAMSGRVFNREAVFFALLTGVAIASYSFLSGIGVRKSGSVLAYIAWLEIATSVGMVAVMFMRKKSDAADFVRAKWRTGLVAGLLSASGYGIALWAMSILPLAPVVAVRETSVVFAAVIGSVALREGFALSRTAAAIAVLVGIILMALA